MNRLAIAKQINNNAGTQGVLDTTVNLQGYQGVLINFMDQAYNDIQILRDGDFKFMRSTVDFSVSATTLNYLNPDIASVDRIVMVTGRVLKRVDYDTWLLMDHTKVKNKLELYTVNPANNEITFDIIGTDCIVQIQYYRVPHIMTKNTDVPILPVQYHSAISYLALAELGAYLGNNELETKYANKYSIIIGQVMRSQVPGKVVRTPSFI